MSGRRPGVPSLLRAGIEVPDLTQGNCQGHHEPDWWFPDESSRMKGHLAKQICDTCPLKQPCLEHGFNEPHGIWGGLSPAERRRLRGESA